MRLEWDYGMKNLLGNSCVERKSTRRKKRLFNQLLSIQNLRNSISAITSDKVNKYDVVERGKVTMMSFKVIHSVSNLLI